MSPLESIPPQETMVPGPPYPPMIALLGGQPTVGLDVPIAAVFMFLYILGAASNMFIFQRNRRAGHKFIMSAMLFGFCMARILTMILRIVWATKPTDIQVAIAAQIFVAAGVLLLFIINLLFAQRVVRASHPAIGWHPAFSWFFRVVYILIPVMLIMTITVTILTFYTLKISTRLVAHDIQLSAQTFLLFVAVLPLPIVAVALAIPRKPSQSLEKFGVGRWRTKVSILLFATALLALGAGFRVGVNFTAPRPIDNPAWFHSKACFWIFNFALEIVVIYLYVFVRVDLRFHVPNQARVHGGYAAAYVAQNAQKRESMISTDDEGSFREKFGERILSEEEVFDGQSPHAGEATADEEMARGKLSQGST